MIDKRKDYIVIQTKKPMNMLMKYADSYMFTAELVLPHQYYFDDDEWTHEPRTEKNKHWGEKKYLIMKSNTDDFHFSIALDEKSCSWFYFSSADSQ